MKVIHYLELKLYNYHGEITPGYEEFISKYAPYRHGSSTSYIFSDSQQLAEAISMLTKQGLPVEHFYKFELATNELETYPALYLGVYCIFEVFGIESGKEKVNANILNDYQMVQDYESERIVVSTKIKKILDGMTKRLSWESIETTNGEECFIMEVQEILPEPIVVPFPVSVEPEDPVLTFAVRSDGRSAITETNIAKLREVGIALSLDVKTPLMVLPWQRRLLASGKVIKALQMAGMKNILELTEPLLLESHLLIAGINQSTEYQTITSV